MAESAARMDDTQAEYNRGCFVILGIGVILVGVAAIGSPLLTNYAMNWIIGWVLIIAGIARAFQAFFIRGAREILIDLGVGIVYIAAGALVISNPAEAVRLITLILAVLFILEGIAKLVQGFRLYREAGWLWSMGSAVLALVIGLLILIGFPNSAVATIGFLVGVYLIYVGISMLFIGPAAVRRPSMLRSAPEPKMPPAQDPDEEF